MGTNNSGEGIGCLFFGVVFCVGVWFMVKDYDWYASWRASQKFDVVAEKIQIVDKHPHDCDFLSAPMGQKHCSYERKYLAEWITLSNDSPPRPISYGLIQSEAPTSCSQAADDFEHKCYYVDLKPGEQALKSWRARRVELHWTKVED